MEDNLINKVVCTLTTIALIFLLVFAIMHGIQANAQEPTSITLKAGTYRFNDNPDVSNVFEQTIELNVTIDGVTGTLGGFAVAKVGNYNQLKILDIDGSGYSVPIYYYDLNVNKYVWTNNIFDIPATEDEIRTHTIPTDTEVDYTFGTWYIANTNYNEVNGNNSITIPFTSIVIPTDIQIMENINIGINGFGSTTSNDNVGVTALNGDTLGRLRKNDGTLIPFNGIAVTSFDSWRPISTFVYPLTDTVIATSPFTISNGLMLYVWDDNQYYQIAWYNPTDSLWYVHGDYAIPVPYGNRSTSSIGTLNEGIAISLSITPNLSIDDIGYVELGSFEDTSPNDNIITVSDDDAYSKFAMFCNANYISDSENLAWGIAQHQSGQNLGQSQQLGDNILGQFLQAPIDILDSIVIYTTPNGTAVTVMGIFGALLTLTLVIIFLKLFAGG